MYFNRLISLRNIDESQGFLDNPDEDVLVRVFPVVSPHSVYGRWLLDQQNATLLDRRSGSAVEVVFIHPDAAGEQYGEFCRIVLERLELESGSSFAFVIVQVCSSENVYQIEIESDLSLVGFQSLMLKLCTLSKSKDVERDINRLVRANKLRILSNKILPVARFLSAFSAFKPGAP